MQKKDKKLVMSIALIILGMILALQFRSTLESKNKANSTAFNIEQLKTRLTEEIERGNTLKSRIAENESEKDNLLNTFFEDRGNDSLVKELEDAKLKAGLTNVKGPGLIVKLKDAPVVKNVNPNNLIIHDADIVRILNEFKKAGAQAISVNGERIIAASEQVCAGPTLRINNRRYAVPFEIKVIGDMDKLEKGLNRSTIMSTLSDIGIRISVERSKEVELSKFKDSVDTLITGLEVVEK